MISPNKVDRAIAAIRFGWERKVRTPQGRVTANGRTQQAAAMQPKARNRATETSMRSASGADVKRGNLHPEQHQIGVRPAFGRKGCPARCTRVGGLSLLVTAGLEG